MIYLMHVSAAMPVAAAPPPGLPDLLSASGQRPTRWPPWRSPRPARAPTSGRRSRRPPRNGAGVTARRPSKSWVTSRRVRRRVHRLDPDRTGAERRSTCTRVPAGTPGLEVAGRLARDGSARQRLQPDDVRRSRCPRTTGSGEPGAGFDLMMQAVLPWFNLGNAAVSVGLSRAAVDAAVRHTSAARLEHLDQSLSALPTIRAQLARMDLDLGDHDGLPRAGRRPGRRAGRTTPCCTCSASRPPPTMRRCGSPTPRCGCAAGRRSPSTCRSTGTSATPGPGHVMAPTADVLYDFYGKAITGQPLF